MSLICIDNDVCCTDKYICNLKCIFQCIYLDTLIYIYKKYILHCMCLVKTVFLRFNTAQFSEIAPQCSLLSVSPSHSVFRYPVYLLSFFQAASNLFLKQL